MRRESVSVFVRLTNEQDADAKIKQYVRASQLFRPATDRNMYIVNFFAALILAAFCSMSEAFTPSAQKKSKSLTFQPARTISGSMPQAPAFQISALRMSDESESNAEIKQVPTSGTYYVDEVSGELLVNSLLARLSLLAPCE
jgi:hypothetical protein